MKDKRLIEMVCKGNVGRSPVAEMVARQYIDRIGASEDYEVSSSGSIANLLLERKLSREMLSNSMKLFSNTGFHNTLFDLLREAWAREDINEIERYTPKVIDFTIASERNKRDQILRELGITGTAKQFPEQTIAKEDVDYIFAIDRKVFADLTDLPNGVYSNARYWTKMHVLGVFATGNQLEKDSEVDLTHPENVWQSYREGIVRIIEHTPIAIRKIMNA